MNTIAQHTPSDTPQILALYPRAFPDEDLCPLVTDLLAAGKDVLSLCSFDQSELVGHIAFTQCTLTNTPTQLALLGPLAVDPEHQKSGIGSALINDGLSRLRSLGTTHVLVLGDPNYYNRFGFQQETAIRPPYALPDEWAPAWQGLDLSNSETPQGTLCVPTPWQPRALWLP